MKKILILLFSTFNCVCAQITNPVSYFQALEPGVSPLIKWEADLNGDGKNEIFISLKDDYDRSIASTQVPGWFVFIAGAATNNFSRPTGIRDDGETGLGVGVVPAIDLKACYFGIIDELGGRGVVTMSIDNPRVGDPIARIYAYTIEGDHLKWKKLAEYNAKQSNALFEKYLKDGKRTVITPVEVTQ